VEQAAHRPEVRRTGSAVESGYPSEVAPEHAVIVDIAGATSAACIAWHSRCQRIRLLAEDGEEGCLPHSLVGAIGSVDP
jgi:hypothetical protein